MLLLKIKLINKLNIYNILTNKKFYFFLFFILIVNKIFFNSNN